MKAAILTLAILSSGCNRSPALAGSSDRPIRTEYAVYQLHASTAMEFRLSDGTRCVTYGYKSITCEWKHAQ